MKTFALSLVFWIALSAQQTQQAVMQIALPATVVLPNINAVNTQAGAAYTLQASDNNGLLVFTSGSPVTLSVPAGLGPGFFVTILQAGAGVVTPMAGAGVAIHQRLQLTKTAGQFAPVFLMSYAPDSFALDGDLQ